MMRTLHKLPSFKTQFTKWGDIQDYILFLRLYFSLLFFYPDIRRGNERIHFRPRLQDVRVFLLTMTKSLIVSIYAFVCDNICNHFTKYFIFSFVENKVSYDWNHIREQHIVIYCRIVFFMIFFLFHFVRNVLRENFSVITT